MNMEMVRRAVEALEKIAKAVTPSHELVEVKADYERVLGEADDLRKLLELERNERKAVQNLYDGLKTSLVRYCPNCGGRQHNPDAPPIDLNVCAACGKDPGQHCYLQGVRVLCDHCYSKEKAQEKRVNDAIAAIAGAQDALRMSGEDMMPTEDGNTVPEQEDGRG